MKQIITALLLVVITSGTAFAKAVSEPQWSDFCPRHYLDATPSKTDKTQNYWYQRRMQFQDVMKQSSQYQGNNLKKFYKQVRHQETKKNRNWKAGAYNNNNPILEVELYNRAKLDYELNKFVENEDK